MSTTFSPALMLGRNTIFASTVLNGDIDTSAKLARLNAAMAECKTFVFDRAYNLTTRSISASTTVFTIPAGLDVIGDHSTPLDLSMMANSGQVKYVFRVDGTAGTAQNLTEDLAKGSETVTLDADKMAALALAPGDRVTIVSDKLFIGGATVGTEEQGEISTVLSASSTSFTISPPAQDSYAMADVARVQKLAMRRGNRFEGLRAIGCGQFSTDTVGDRMFHVVWADAPRIIGCSSEYLDNGSYLYSCPDARVDGWKAVFQPQNGRTSSQYGLSLVNACQDAIVDDWTVVGGKHAVVQTESGTARGVSRRIKVQNGFASGQWNFAMATHTNAEQIEFIRNKVNGANGGIDAGCRGVTTIGNEMRFIWGTTLGIGIQVSEVPENFVSRGDRVYGGRFALRCDTAATPPLAGSIGPVGIDVSDFYAERFTQAGVWIECTGLTGRSDVTLRDINTREAGGGSTGVTAAPSIRIAGGITRVVVDGANLQAASGNTSICLQTADIDSGRIRNVDYVNHSAPSLGGTDVTSTNVNAF